MKLKTSLRGFQGRHVLREHRPMFAALSVGTRENDVSELSLLEEEIHQLRQIMEQAFLVEKEFTADLVITISRQLDEKINQYMRLSKGN